MSAHRRQQLFILVGLVALSFNLRPAAISVGPVLSEVRTGLSMSPTTAGVVTTLPVLCFAAFASVAPWVARRVGMHRVMLLSLVLTAAALFVRAEAGNTAAFIAATFPALAGMATANVLLPSLVKRHFPDRIGLLTSIYSTFLAVGLTFASVLTVPISEIGGSWRVGLAAWGVTAGVAALPWLGLVRHDVRPENAAGDVTTMTAGAVARSPLAWAMALFFASQSLQAYAIFGWLPQIFRDAGFSAATAGLLLGLTTAISIPISFALPPMVVRRTNQAPLILTLCGSYVAGYVGLIVWPAAGALVWAVLIGVGTGMFPLALTLIGLRARTSDGTAALSGFTQSVGYLVAAVGPFMMGAVYGATGGWTVPLIVLTVLIVPQAVTGWMVARPRYVEDEVARRTPTGAQPR
ncbi:MAG: MFS transporter [Nocardioidaceae bacterium]|nr:MFS transporter [Nocardioidaceae bacterium]